MMPHSTPFSAPIARLTIYPIKSLPGLNVNEAIVGPSGALVGDRRWAIIDADENFVNSKRTARVHELGYELDPLWRQLTLIDRRSGRSPAFQLPVDYNLASEWLSECLQHAVRLVENLETGFPDDLEAPGPTIVSTATYEAVAEWFARPLEEVRARFRTNVELTTVEPFAEDQLFGASGTIVPITIGKVTLAGTNPCQRCVVPSRDPVTGEVLPSFAKQFAERREETLPNWSERGRFNHFYRLAVNTRLISGAGTTIRVGDLLQAGLPTSC